MKAATFHGVGKVAVTEKPSPAVLEPGDVVVEVEVAGLCGSDLHPYRGRETGLDVGTTLGHEFTGRIVEVGSEVVAFDRGDVVMSPFTTACGACGPCRRGLSARCEQGQVFGWVEQGQGLEGAQTEYVRVPLAESTLLPRDPRLSPLEALLLGDVVATGFYVASRGGVGAGRPVAVVGLGAVGLAAVMASRRLGAEPVIGLDAVRERLDLAESLGAAPVCVAGDDGTPRDGRDIVAEIGRLCGGDGLPVVLEVVGNADATRLAATLLQPGGTLSVGGVHTDPVFAIPPGLAYDKNLTIHMGRCPARSRMESLCEMQLADRLPLERLVSHRFPLADAADAYRMFDARRDGCIKVAFEP